MTDFYDVVNNDLHNVQYPTEYDINEKFNKFFENSDPSIFSKQEIMGLFGYIEFLEHKVKWLRRL